MIVSNNPLLNILLPKDNKVLTDVLKEADSKSLEQLVNNKGVSKNEILKNLFDDIKNNTKSNASVENLLKNSSIFKNLGSFTATLSTILDEIDSNENMTKFKAVLNEFFKDIKNIDENSLKEQLSKSGVFLESSLGKNSGSNLNKSITNILSQIQNLIKDINTPETKQINQLINNLTSSNESTKQTNDIKSLLSALQTLNTSLNDKSTQNLSALTNQLKSIISQASLVESKNQNSSSSLNLENKNQINTQTKDVLLQLKNEISTNIKISNPSEMLSKINDLLKTNDLFSKNEQQIQTKQAINNLTNTSEIKNLSNSNQNISNLVLNLKNISNEISNLENKALSSINITEEKNSLTSTLKDALSNLKNELSNIKGIDLKDVNQMISKLENIQNIFNKVESINPNTSQLLQSSNLSTFSNNFSSNLNSLLISLKENITNLAANQNNPSIQNQILNTIDNIESALKDNIQKDTQTNVNKDIKSILLQMQEELQNKPDLKSQELTKQVDKMLMQIDYHQLLSHTSNSNYVYVPFFWDMLEDGTINMKKTDEEKFYCQINLTLKDFGKVDLMLSLYDKNKLDLTIMAQRDHFKIAVRDNIQNLKQALNDVELIPVNIKLLNLEEDKKTAEHTKVSVFENVYSQNTNTSLDIRV